MNATNRRFEDIAVGDSASFEHTISAEEVTTFALLSGDENPLHTDETYAKQTEFGGRVVHGMFLVSLISRLVGMDLPGTRSLLLKESVEFKKPARIGDKLTISGTVTHVSNATRILELAVEIRTPIEILAVGTVHARVRT